MNKSSNPDSTSDDLQRLRREYADRERRLKDSDIYSRFNLANLFILQQRQREILAFLRQNHLNNLKDSRILEIGCGKGGVLVEFLSFGSSPRNLYGCELLEDHVHNAQQSLPGSPLSCADGQHLPYFKETFDLVMQFTMMSSILDPVIRQRIAQEMLRVLKPSGLILWYDFWLNPTNPQTHGIRPAEIHQLFPGCTIKFRRITLAPPLTRALAPISWLACGLLEKLWLLNTHYLAAIQKL